MSLGDKMEYARQISLISRKIQLYLNKELKTLNLTSSEYIYLLLLSNDDTFTQDELSAKVMIDKAQTTRVLASLESKGYIERVKKVEDKRSKLVSLTESGKKVVPAIKKKVKRLEELLIRNIPRNYIGLLDMSLKTMNSNVEDEINE